MAEDIREGQNESTGESMGETVNGLFHGTGVENETSSYFNKIEGLLGMGMVQTVKFQKQYIREAGFETWKRALEAYIADPTKEKTEDDMQKLKDLVAFGTIDGILGMSNDKRQAELQKLVLKDGLDAWKKWITDYKEHAEEPDQETLDGMLQTVELLNN